MVVVDNAFSTEATINKFIFDLDNYLFLDRTGLISEISTMSDIDFDRYAVRHPKTNQIDRELTIKQFSDDLDTWLEDRISQSNKYREAILGVFQKFGKMGQGFARIYAMQSAGLPPTAESQELIDDAISLLLEQGELVRHGTKGKGAGLSLPSAPPTIHAPGDQAEEPSSPELEEEEEQEEPPQVVQRPALVARPSRESPVRSKKRRR